MSEVPRGARYNLTSPYLYFKLEYSIDARFVKGDCLLTYPPSPSPFKERGIKGVRLITIIRFYTGDPIALYWKYEF